MLLVQVFREELDAKFQQHTAFRKEQEANAGGYIRAASTTFSVCVERLLFSADGMCFLVSF